jgi:hypothetical protein
MRAVLLVLVATMVPLTAAQGVVDSWKMPPEVMQYAKTDGVPLDLDDAATLAAVRDVQARISGGSIHDCVYNITVGDGPSYRLMGSPTQDEFVQAHKDVFAKVGLPSALHNFTQGGPGLVPPPEQLQGGTNIVGVLPGRDLTKWVVLGGHYDTRELTLGGGALDNASGICTVLELAKAFKANADAMGPLDASVVFLWYDGEEWGLYGSVAFAQDTHVAKELLGIGNLSVQPTILVSQSYDMPGLNYPAKNLCPCYGDPAVADEYAVLNLRTAPIHDDQNWTCWSYGCYEELKANPDFARIERQNIGYQFLVREVAYDVLKLPPQYVWVYDDHYGRSDHIPLIALGAAGMRIQGSHDEEYPHYHQPTDSLPGLYALTGGADGLKAGYQAEAQAGGLAAYYVAKTGGMGRYGDVNYLHMPKDAAAAGGPTQETKPSPGLAPLGLVAALGLAAAISRRR